MKLLRGEMVAGGVALGRVYLRGYAQEAGYALRIPSDEVEHELNRLRDALERSRAQIEEIRSKQEKKLSGDELRIFDAHLTYLQDPLFIDEIERQVMHERYSVAAAIAKVIADYDRIVALVENDMLRRRAADFRDVGTRVQRNLSDSGSTEESVPPSERFILAAARLTTTDLFDIDNEQIDGIVAEEGGISSHAAILARSMGIPTITGIRNLPSVMENGDFIVVDATSGEVIVEPDDELIAKYRHAADEFEAERNTGPEEETEHATRDGTEVRIYASCGSAGEAELARTYGMDGIGVYRSELSFLSEERLPDEDALVSHYEPIIRQPGDQPAYVRLLDVSGSTRLPSLPTANERNPTMGQRGIRRLLANSALLRLQIRAILRAARGTANTAILVPFVTGVSDLARVKTAVLEERQALRKRSEECADTLLVAPIIEVPAAAFVVSAFLAQSDFVVVALDDLQAHLLAADRDNGSVREYYEMVHPAVFEILSQIAREGSRRNKRIVLFGEAASDVRRLPMYLGVGIRDFSIAPVRMRVMLRTLRRYTMDECRKIADKILQAPRALDIERILVHLAGE